MPAEHDFDPGDLDELAVRLSTNLADPTQRLALIVGAGTSMGAVAGVGDINTALIKALSKEFGPTKTAEWFEGLNQGLTYQNAASRVGRALGSDSVNTIIRAGVLRACPTVAGSRDRAILSDDERLKSLEYQGAWTLPLGVAALGRLLCRFADKISPVITTNFDPLIEVGVRLAGGTAASILLDDKGFEKSGADYSAQVRVHHVHGFWRDGDTLNTVRQLTGNRPGLRAHLRTELAGKTVLTLGYSGWDDAFMRSLRERLDERNELDLEMLWSQYSPDPQRLLDNPSLGHLLTSPKTYFYVGIDANRLIPSVESRTQSVSVNQSTLKVPAGWRHIDPDQPSQISGTKSHGLDFGMGGHPSWKDATDGRWPVFSFASDAHADLLNILDSGRGRGIAILAPTGEGKSMTIRQVALMAAAARPELTVVAQEIGARLTPDVVQWAHNNGPSLLVIDDIDLVFQDAMATRHEWAAPGSSVTILATCQTRYWMSLGLSQLGLRTKEIGSVSLEDCTKLAQAWRDAGPSYEGELTHLPIDVGARRLFDSASGSIGMSQRPSLLGAILHTRDGAGFRDRVLDLLFSLRRSRPLGNSHSLYELFLAICITQRYGVGLSTQVAAKLMDTDVEMLGIAALPALAREAAIALRNDRVVTRHRMIAAAAVSLAKSEFPEEWNSRIEGIIQASVWLADEAESRHERREYEKEALLCKRLEGDDAVTAALKIASAMPKSLWICTSAMKALRVNGCADVAREEGIARLKEVQQMTDGYENMRVFINELGVVHGNLGLLQVNSWLSLLSVSDQLREAAPFGTDIVRVSTQCAASALIKLHRQTGLTEYQDAVCVLDNIASLLNLHDSDWTEINNFVDRAETSHLEGVSQQTVFAAACWRLATDPGVVEIAAILDVENLTWHNLSDSTGSSHSMLRREGNLN